MLNLSKIESDINSNNLQSKDVSAIIGVKYTTTINRREKGNWTPNDIEKLADYFNRPIAYYFDREEQGSSPKGLVSDVDPVVYGCSSCRKKQREIDKLKLKLGELKGELLEVHRKYVQVLEDLQQRKAN